MASKSPAVEIEVDDRVVRVTNPDRVYFPARGETKLDLVEYYLSVARRHRQRPARAALHAAPLPHRRERREGAPEAAAGRCAAVDGDGAGALPPLEPDRRRAVRHRDRPGGLGRADVDGRVPPVEQPEGGHREARRVADRPRPGRRVRLRHGAPGRPRDARGARRARGDRLPEDLRRQGPAHLRADPPGARLQGRTTGGAGVRARGRAPHRRRDDDLVAQGPRPHEAVRGLQPERPRPHDRCGLLRARQPRGDGLHPDPVGRGRRRRSRATSPSRRCPPATPRSATSTPASTTPSST